MEECAERLVSEATLLDDLGRLDDARELLLLSLRLAETSRAFWYLGKLQMKRGEIADAVTSLQRAHVLLPSHGPTRFELARAYKSQDNLKGALEHIEALLEASPTHPSAQSFKFEILARTERIEEAIAFFEGNAGLAEARVNRLIYFLLLVRTGQKGEGEFAELGLKRADLMNRPTWL